MPGDGDRSVQMECKLEASPRISCTATCLLLLLMIPGCSCSYSLTLTGQVLRGEDHLPVIGATVTLFGGVEGKIDYCSTTTDSDGRWSLTAVLYENDFWTDSKERRWLMCDPPYPEGAPKADHPYSIRVETDEGAVKCSLPTISTPEECGELIASMFLLIDASFASHERAKGLPQ